ncbi:Purple acid phosphatase [Labilithrix luteola]|uniref:Purple acid phosphatase n=1 Tax=Labilithrix luteola TaxID=1391654 RepID=A0A0K1PNX5_9BACT|nr:metallophosphoesterase [Labilithrix luteola]AKU95235.1 Purple acid phosphatase [Labilithrix luteola]
MSLRPLVSSASAVLAAVLALAACGGDSEGAASGPQGDTTGGGTSKTDPSPTPSSSSKPGQNTPPPAGSNDAGTPPPATKAVRFVAMGDTGSGDPGQYKIANAISAKCKADGCDFVMLLGDNIYESGASSVDDPVFQERFETPYAAIDLDFFAVLGNHDYGGEGAGYEFGKGQNEVDYTKKSKKWKMPSAYYHFVKENVEFFGLDTNKQMFGQDAQQRTDVAAWMAASTATWKIAVGHHPYYSNGTHGNAGNYDGVPLPYVSGNKVKSFMDDVVCGKTDLYFSGHDHSRQWMNVSCKGTELAVSGAGAKSTELPGNNPTLFQSLELGFLYVVIEGKKLTAEFVDENANVEFTHVINKP